jgi:signal transduction histidine kinase
MASFTNRGTHAETASLRTSIFAHMTDARMFHYVIQAQEEERKRVSRDLHDGVGQALYSILVGMKVLSQLPMDEALRTHLADLQQLTASALEEVKSLAVELRPSVLDDLGLVSAVRSYVKRFEQTPRGSRLLCTGSVRKR